MGKFCGLSPSSRRDYQCFKRNLPHEVTDPAHTCRSSIDLDLEFQVPKRTIITAIVSRD